MKKVTARERIKVYFVVTLALKSSFTLSKLQFLGLRSAAIKRGQRMLADDAERER